MSDNKVNQFVYIAENNGKIIQGFVHISSDWMVKYLNLKRAGLHPKVDESRDLQDYELRYENWVRKGTEFSKPYSDFDEMIEEETKCLSRE